MMKRASVKTYILSFQFTCHGFSTLDDLVAVTGNSLSIGNINGPWSSANCEPSSHFIPAEEAKLLL